MSEKINILVVEDEPIVALDLVTGLENAGYEIAGIATNSRDAKSLFLNNPIDITLMDIHLKGEKDGIDTVKELMEIRSTPVIYLTAFTDPATITRVKNTYPAAFLTKPYRIDNVLVAIELALHNFANRGKPEENTRPVSPDDEKETVVQWNDHLFIKVNYRFIKIPIADILYVAAENSYIHLVTAERKYPLRMVLGQFMEKTGNNPLVRIHRSYAVNVDLVQSFTEQEVTIGKDTLPISKSYRDAFLQQFGLR
jgi:DNA-binding LytR/AlgR family response regulator